MKRTQKRAKRLVSAKKWIKIYPGKNLVKGYAKKFLVDKLCAVKELRMPGVEVSEEYEKQLIDSKEANRKHRLALKEKYNPVIEYESDEYFAEIIGYTPGGVPYGVTHEEMEEIEYNDWLINELMSDHAKRAKQADQLEQAELAEILEQTE